MSVRGVYLLISGQPQSLGSGSRKNLARPVETEMHRRLRRKTTKPSLSCASGGKREMRWVTSVKLWQLLHLTPGRDRRLQRSNNEM